MSKRKCYLLRINKKKVIFRHSNYELCNGCSYFTPKKEIPTTCVDYIKDFHCDFFTYPLKGQLEQFLEEGNE